MVCKNKSQQQQRTGLVRAGSHRLSARHASWLVVVGLGVGTIVACVPYFYAAVMSVVVDVVVVVTVVLLVVYVYMRVMGCSCHPRGLVLGRAGGMPPTGANIAVLVLKTDLTPGSS